MQMYILMIDYGTDVRKVHGLEAIVKPELTRQNIVDQARDVLARGDSIAFVKFIDGNWIEDCTAEIVSEAEQLEDA